MCTSLISDKRIPYYLRDINNPPPHLNEEQKRNWIRAAEKAKKNYELQQHYPPFTIPTSMYKVKYVNKYTTIDTMKLLINHVERCEEYSIDTEGEKSTKELALIQIQSIPHELPMFVIMVELSHLPREDSPSNIMTKKFFRLIFRSGNKMYSWGSLEKEFLSMKNNELFDWPIEASPYDIQFLFTNWYNWALSQCGIGDPSRRHITGANNVISTCHRPSPYRLNEPWSLQKALQYASGLFIDKLTTLNHWSTLLDPSHSTLSFRTREKLIHYAIYDCFTTSYFIKPVCEYWTFEKLAKTNFIKLFTTSSRSSSIINNNDKNINYNIKKINKINKNIDGQTLMNVLDDSIELISEEEDDEILAGQGISSVINNDGLYEIILNNDDGIAKPVEQNTQEIIEHDQVYENILDGELEIELHNVNDVQMSDQGQSGESSSTKPGVSKHQTRSAAARHRRNQKRNMIHRRKRYRYSIKRYFYH